MPVHTRAARCWPSAVQLWFLREKLITGDILPEVWRFGSWEEMARWVLCPPPGDKRGERLDPVFIFARGAVLSLQDSWGHPPAVPFRGALVASPPEMCPQNPPLCRPDGQPLCGLRSLWIWWTCLVCTLKAPRQTPYGSVLPLEERGISVLQIRPDQASKGSTCAHAKTRRRCWRHFSVLYFFVRCWLVTVVLGRRPSPLRSASVLDLVHG